MFAVHEKYITDEKGQKQAIVLPYHEWKKIQNILEEYEDIRAYDRAKKKKSNPVSFNEVVSKLKNV